MTVKYIPLESKSGFKSPGFSVLPSGQIEATTLVLSEPLVAPNILFNGVELISGADSTISLSDGITHSYLEKLGTLQYLNIDGDFTVSQASTAYISVINGEIRITNPENLTLQVYENIAQTTAGVVTNSSNGSAAVFTVTRDNGYYTASITNAGINFNDADTLVIPGTLLGGESPTNNLTITVVAVDPLNSNSIFTISVAGTAVSESHGSMNNIDVGLTTPARGKFTDIVSTGNVEIAVDLDITGNTIGVGTAQFDSVRAETAPTEVYHLTRKDYVDTRATALSIALGS